MNTEKFNIEEFLLITEDTIIEEKRESKKLMKPNMFTKSVKSFGKGFVKQITTTETLCIGAGAGLSSGLKYKGSLRTGLLTCAATILVLGTLNGITYVSKDWEDNKEALKVD